MNPPRPQPAVLQSVAETETAYGGRDRVWSQAASLWVSLTVAAPAQETGDGATPREAQTAAADSRDHPDAAIGQRLLVGDDPDPWRVRRVDRGVPSLGRMTLRLDRLL